MTQEIWHCHSQPDRELAEMLVGQEMPWFDLATHFSRPYPQTEADKFDLAYRLIGCKK